MESNKDGSYKGWNSIWGKKQSSNDYSILFTKGKAKNILEFWQKCYYEDLKGLLKKGDIKRFLELGSGRATTSMYLSNDGYTDITLVDLSENALELAKVNFTNCNLQLPKTVLADARKTNLPASSFDCIYNIGLLEHFEDVEPVIAETARLLAKGGIVFMPIFPKVSAKKSLLSRMLFSPASLIAHFFKKAKKTSIVEASKNEESIVRNTYGPSYYTDLIKKYNLTGSCNSYNPYWGVNQNKQFEKLVTLNAYKFSYFLQKSFYKPPYMRAKKWNGLAYILIARK